VVNIKNLIWLIDVVNPRCKSDWCELKNMKDYCMSCFVNNPENADKP
jgi:hypothetical protein